MAHPYQGLPARQYWNSAMQRSGGVPQVDVMSNPRFLLGRTDRIATMGSCFSQHLGRFLHTNGYQYFFLESDGAGDPPIFSCRYGNVYTARHALQLLQRSRSPEVDTGEIWERNGRYFDAYRPLTQPEGYASPEDVLRDRAAHLRAVRTLFRETDVLMFTLGLTETWTHRESGTVYPSAPGVIAGEYDPTVHSFHNFRPEEISRDLSALLTALREENPGIRVILTVSPVSIAATYEERHVWTSTTYTKAALRVAADAAVHDHDFVDYLPTYEAIMAPTYRYRFLSADNRTIEPAGVRHAMRLFAAYFGQQESGADGAPPIARTPMVSSYDVICDEEYNAS